MRALKEEVLASLGPEDLAHLKKLERWGRAAALLGYALAWFPNPLAPLLISLGATGRWTCVTHHVLHKGMDRVPGTPARLTSLGFARGWRRFLDWFDWIHPGAWSHEHNVLHHAYTNEAADPDLVQDNVGFMRNSTLPRWLKLVGVFFSACTWKFTYYVPNTMQILQRKRRRKQAQGNDVRADARGPESTFAAFDLRTADGREVWWRCLLPYAFGRFVVMPALFLPLGPSAAFWVLVSSLIAEVLTNLHSYAVVVPNHAGDDLYRFAAPPKHRHEWFARQVVASVNFRTGGDVNDFLHGFLNYQIEHHLFPDLPPRQYQRIAPRVKAACAQYGIPYVQQPLPKRLGKLFAVMVGDASMPNA